MFFEVARQGLIALEAHLALDSGGKPCTHRYTILPSPNLCIRFSPRLLASAKPAVCTFETAVLHDQVSATTILTGRGREILCITNVFAQYTHNGLTKGRDFTIALR